MKELFLKMGMSCWVKILNSQGSIYFTKTVLSWDLIISLWRDIAIWSFPIALKVWRWTLQYSCRTNFKPIILTPIRADWRFCEIFDKTFWRILQRNPAYGCSIGDVPCCSVQQNISSNLIYRCLCYRVLLFWMTLCHCHESKLNIFPITVKFIPIYLHHFGQYNTHMASLSIPPVMSVTMGRIPLLIGIYIRHVAIAMEIAASHYAPLCAYTIFLCQTRYPRD